MIDLPSVHRVSAMARLDDAREHFVDARVDVERDDLCAWHHDLPSDRVFELEDASEHLGVLLRDGAGLFALLDHMLDGQLGESPRVFQLDLWHEPHNQLVDPAQGRRKGREQQIDGP